jgi:hypothetical protein
VKYRLQFAGAGNSATARDLYKQVYDVMRQQAGAFGSTSKTDSPGQAVGMQRKLPEKQADYDAIATGKWIPVLGRDTDLQNRRVSIPDQRACDVIIRARVKKLSGQNLAMYLRRDAEHAPKRGYSAWFNGGNWFGIHSVRQKKSVMECHTPTNFDDYFEFAFSAVGEMLTIYVDGKRIGQVRDPDYRLGLGFLGINAFHSRSLFQDVEIMILD